MRHIALEDGIGVDQQVGIAVALQAIVAHIADRIAHDRYVPGHLVGIDTVGAGFLGASPGLGADAVDDDVIADGAVDESARGASCGGKYVDTAPIVPRRTKPVYEVLLYEYAVANTSRCRYSRY
jgi:hypothetical protein